MKNFFLIIGVSCFLLASCVENPIAIADFEAVVTITEMQAEVELINNSINADSYLWTMPTADPDSSMEMSPTIVFTENGTHSITLEASNATSTDSKTIELTFDTLYEHIPYRYLENDGLFIYYETDNEEVYESLLPEGFDMPSRMLVHVFIIDFYELDNGAIPYKENAIFILAEYEGEEVWHCVYMPVTDEISMWSGIIGLGLPKSMGEIEMFREDSVYYGNGTGYLGGTMHLNVETEGYEISDSLRQELIDLSSLRNLQIRNGQVVVVGKDTGGNSAIETAENFPNFMTVKFGECSVITNTDEIFFNHALDLTPSEMIGGYYLWNSIPFGLTGNPI